MKSSRTKVILRNLKGILETTTMIAAANDDDDNMGIDDELDSHVNMEVVG